MDFERLKELPTIAIKGYGYCRFHEKKYFHASPAEFYKNFLECRRTFRNWARFAGPAFHSGLYFASNEFVAIAECSHYLLNFPIPSRKMNWRTPLKAIGGLANTMCFFA